MSSQVPLRDVLALRLDGSSRFLDAVFIRLLGIFLGPDRFRLRSLCVVNDLLDHIHDTTRRRLLVLGLKSQWRRQPRWLLAPQQRRGLLSVKLLQDLESCLRELSREIRRLRIGT